jgi:hypothetical protein
MVASKAGRGLFWLFQLYSRSRKRHLYQLRKKIRAWQNDRICYKLYVGSLHSQLVFLALKLRRITTRLIIAVSIIGSNL